MIDPDQLAKLAEMACTEQEVAAWFGMPVKNVRSRLSRQPLKGVWERGQARGFIALRRAMYQAAVEQKNVTAQIWLSKNYLGMTDRVDQNNTNTNRMSFVVELPPPMDARDWAAVFAPRAAPGPAPSLPAPPKAGEPAE